MLQIEMYGRSGDGVARRDRDKIPMVINKKARGGGAAFLPVRLRFWT
jgi:hypothetical protein